MAEETRRIPANVWVYLLFLFMVGGTITAIVIGQQQDETYKEYDQINQQVQQKFKDHKVDEAEADLKKLLAVNPDSYQVHWQYGLSLMVQGKYAEAEQQLTQARELYPYLVQNQQYDAQYGEVLYYQKKFDQAKRYFVEAQKLSTDPTLSANLAVVLKDIDEQTHKK